MTDKDLDGVVERVVEAVREAASEPLEAGAAQAAARVVVEVQDEELWWLIGRTVRVWVATFGTGADSVATEHWTDRRGQDAEHRRFAPYLPA